MATKNDGIQRLVGKTSPKLGLELKRTQLRQVSGSLEGQQIGGRSTRYTGRQSRYQESLVSTD
jgi:hypothetical protein